MKVTKFLFAIYLVLLVIVASCGETEHERLIRKTDQLLDNVDATLKYHETAKQAIEDYKQLREELSTPSGASDVRDSRHVDKVVRLGDHCARIRDSHDFLLSGSGFIDTLDMVVEWLPHVEATVDSMAADVASESRCDEIMQQGRELKARFLREGGTSQTRAEQDDV